MSIPSALRDDCARSLGLNGAGDLESLRNTTLVITGASGFMGIWLTSLCAHLNDAHAFNLKLVLTARRQGRMLAIAPWLSQREDIRFIQSDIRQFIDMPKETDWIIHAAATPNGNEHATNPMETMAAISEGTYRVLRTAEQCVSLRMMLHVSSASIYGPQPQTMEAIPEDYTGAVATTAVQSAYAEAKRYSETLCVSARNQSRTPLVIGRPFAFLGPFQPLEAPWAINNFLHAAVHGQALKIFGDGSTVRTYLYGSDMAACLLRMLVKGRSGAIYNLGHSEEVSLKNLAAKIVQLADPALEIRFNTGGKSVGVSRLVPNMRRATDDLGFTPAFSLDDALRRTLAWNQQKQRAA